MQKNRWILVGAVAVGLLGAGYFFSCRGKCGVTASPSGDVASRCSKAMQSFDR